MVTTKSKQSRRETASGRALIVRQGASGVRSDNYSAEITLPAGALRSVVSHKAGAAGVLAGWSKAVDRAERTGKPVRLTVLVDPRNNAPEIVVEKIDKEEDELHASLVEAKARGAERVAEILNAVDMLSADQFAELIGATRETVHQKRRRHEILGLEGPKRGVRFPLWQLSPDGTMLPGLPKLFEAFGGRPWAVYRFLVSPHPELGDLTALAALRREQVDEVVSLAAAIGSGSFS